MINSFKISQPQYSNGVKTNIPPIDDLIGSLQRGKVTMFIGANIGITQTILSNLNIILAPLKKMQQGETKVVKIARNNAIAEWQRTTDYNRIQYLTSKIKEDEICIVETITNWRNFSSDLFELADKVIEIYHPDDSCPTILYPINKTTKRRDGIAREL